MSLEYVTSESVTKGHPDKLCDQIADSVLDEILKKDPEAHVACEVTATTGLVHVFGEISTNCYVDIPSIARKTVNLAGYSDVSFGFNGNTCAVLTSINSQSQDIAMGVNESCEYKLSPETDLEDKIGAGDQGIMYGYACSDTPTFMPMPIFLAHKITKALSDLREKGVLNYLRPDGKTQITLEYKKSVPYRVKKIVISSQHSEEVSLKKIRDDLTELIVYNSHVIPEDLLSKDPIVIINPTGKFTIGGPVADSGLTGRKIMVDTYGGIAHHGGGAFSGKDPTKVDRSGAYMARYVAKNIVASGLALKCEIHVGYAIGVAKPVSLGVECFGTSTYSNGELISLIKKVFDFRPGAIIENFKLKRPIYKGLAVYGHFGREDLDLPWEKIDKAEELLEKVSFKEKSKVFV